MRNAKPILELIALYGGLAAFLFLGPARMAWWISFLAGATFAFFTLHLFRRQIS